MSTILQAIGSTVSDDPLIPGNSGIAKPIDLLCLQEAHSSATTGQAYAALLNQIYNTTRYAAGTLDGATTGSGTQVYVYNSELLQLSGMMTAIGTSSTTGQPRQAISAGFSLVGYSLAGFSVVNSHFKAGTAADDKNRRQIEAQAILDARGDSPNVILLGDLNIYRSSEQAYQTLTAGGGRFRDPINAPGNWDGNVSFKAIHTQSPFDASLGTGFPGTAGGMDDRLDHQLVTEDMLDGKGIDYIPNSYHAFGNNGSHAMNAPINSGTGTSPAVLNALAGNLDHLPVVADYQLPARPEISMDLILPPAALVGPSVPVTFRVGNSAPTAFQNGADEYEYFVSYGHGSIAVGQAASTAFAATAANVHTFAINCSVAGNQSPIVGLFDRVNGNNVFRQTVSQPFTVLKHAVPSFGPAGPIANVATIDFGIWPITGVEPGDQTIVIRNAATVGDSSSLLRDLISGSDAVVTVTDSLANIAPGAAGTITAAFEPSAGNIGSINRAVVFTYGDINAPNRQTYQLTLNIIGRIAWPGDANLDGQTNISDFSRLAAHFNEADTPWQFGDFNRDTRTDITDFAILAANFNTAAPLTRAVPEASAAMSLGCIILAARRRAVRFVKKENR